MTAQIFWFGEFLGLDGNNLTQKLFALFDWPKTVNLWNLFYMKVFEILVKEIKPMQALSMHGLLKNGVALLKELLSNNETTKKNDKLKTNDILTIQRSWVKYWIKNYFK